MYVPGWLRRLNARGLRQTPEIIAVEQLDADLAPALRVVAAVNDATLDPMLEAAQRGVCRAGRPRT